jgi:hypothetical protein
MMNGIKEIADGFGAELKRRLPKQRKTQRTKLALLVATMLDVRSANLMELAAGLPREADRTDMRYQWISRLLGNPLVVSDEIMEPFSREVLERAGAGGQPIVLILDQSKIDLPPLWRFSRSLRGFKRRGGHGDGADRSWRVRTAGA